MSEIEKYYNGEIIVDFEEETELEKPYQIQYLEKQLERLDSNCKTLAKLLDQEIDKINKAIEYIEGQNEFISGCDVYRITNWEYVLKILKGEDKE